MSLEVVEAARACWCGGKCPHAEEPLRLEQEKRRGQADQAWRRALLEAPDCVEAHKGIARGLTWSTHAKAAGAHIARAIGTAGETGELALLRAQNLRHQVTLDAAITAAYRAVTLAPDKVHALNSLALAYHAAGDTSGMGETLKLAGELYPNAPALRYARALLAVAGKDYERARDVLAGDDLTAVELFERGRAKERLKDYAGAWSDWMKGKAMQREQGCIYQQEAMARTFADLLEHARPSRLARYRNAAAAPHRPGGRRPIFVTGFPRSGTTMVEAVLSRHPDVAAGDELPFLEDVIARAPGFLNARAPYPKAMMAFGWPENARAAAALGDWYVAGALEKIGVDQARPFFTDKMLSNELHLALIGVLFEGCTVVHVRRHPLDILVSNMSHSLVHGQYNACALEWCALHYALTDRLVNHYRKLDRGLLGVNLVELRYESFVADHRAQTAALLERCGLSPAPECADFHLSAWHSRTISHRQIKEPVNDKSVGRFRPFLEYLKPVLPTLRETMEREGYGIG